MKIEYFRDTDTALIKFTAKSVHETKEISENIYINVDEDGNLVSMTIAHAKVHGTLPEIHYKEVSSSAV